MQSKWKTKQFDGVHEKLMYSTKNPKDNNTGSSPAHLYEETRSFEAAD